MKTMQFQPLILLILGFLIFSLNSIAQVSINTDSTLAHPSAGLDVKFSDKGVLFPRMTMAERDAIVNPANGLIVICTDCGVGGTLSIFLNGIWRIAPVEDCNILAPISAGHFASATQIMWNWDAVTGATGYKWNTSDDYGSATDVGSSTSKTESGLVCDSSFTRYVWAYNSCGSTASTVMTKSTAGCTFSCGDYMTIIHVAGNVAPVSKTVMYGTVTNVPGEPDKCWITSNLGADCQADSVNDISEASAGWYWQFNKKQGYKHDGTNRTPNSSWINDITENSEWIWTNDPCISELGNDWRVPTHTELLNIKNSGGWATWTDPWNSLLKLHAAGTLKYDDGSLFLRGSSGAIISSSQASATENWYLTFYQGGNGCDVLWNSTKTFGMNIRCLRMICEIPAQPTAGTHSTSPNQIIWNWTSVLDATGYKWNIYNDPVSAIDLGTATSKTETGLSCSTTYTRYVWAYNSCGNSIPVTLTKTITNCSWSCGTSLTINHAAGVVAPINKTVTYNTVTNVPGEEAKCWITSNLGADHQATSVSDITEASAGWYWQFNRNRGFKHDGIIRTPNSTWISNIYENSDWLSANDPCSHELGGSWRIPTSTEWTNVDLTGNWTDWNGPWNSTLKLHAAGHLDVPNGAPNYRGVSGQYWSGMAPDVSNATGLVFNNAGSGVYSGAKALAMPCRCINDCGLTSPIQGTHTPSQNQIIWIWSTVSGASGYKWNVYNDFSTATDVGVATLKIERGLACNTAYTRYVWAYNSCGHSNPVILTSSTTACSGTCGSPVTDSRDGKSYNTVLIGNQCWFAQNLNVGTRIDSTVSPTNNGVIQKYCYRDLVSNCDIYGGMYRWDEMMYYASASNSNPSGRQGICPSGWHLPSDAEWCQMEMFLDPTVECNIQGERGTDVGGKVKESGTSHWNSPNTGASNTSGFTALPGGIYYDILEYCYSNQKYTGMFSSTSTMGYENSSIMRLFSYIMTTSIRNLGGKSNALSVRCVRNDCQALSTPQAGTHTSLSDQITWNWTTVSGATGYRWNYTDDYYSSIDAGASPSYIETGLPCNTYYTRYVWAYNSCGFSNSAELIKSTSACSGDCGQPFTDSRNGKTYKTVAIGTQCWFADNLNIGTRIDKSVVQTNNGTIEKYCYNDMESYCNNPFGGLYTWDEMMNYSSSSSSNPSDRQGICPSGWHLPSDAEWCQMEVYLDPSVLCSATSWRGVNAGGKMKDSGTGSWAPPNKGGSNLSGLTVRSGGYLDLPSQIYYGIGGEAYLWACSESSTTDAWLRMLSYTKASVSRDGKSKNSNAFSVRCVKD